MGGRKGPGYHELASLPLDVHPARLAAPDLAMAASKSSQTTHISPRRRVSTCLDVGITAMRCSATTTKVSQPQEVKQPALWDRIGQDRRILLQHTLPTEFPASIRPQIVSEREHVRVAGLLLGQRSAALRDDVVKRDCIVLGA